MVETTDYKAELLKSCVNKKYSKDSLYEIIFLMPKPSDQAKNKKLKRMNEVVKTSKTEEEALEIIKNLK